MIKLLKNIGTFLLILITIVSVVCGVCSIVWMIWEGMYLLAMTYINTWPELSGLTATLMTLVVIICFILACMAYDDHRKSC